jgi:hypothetical protein
MSKENYRFETLQLHAGQEADYCYYENSGRSAG